MLDFLFALLLVFYTNKDIQKLVSYFSNVILFFIWILWYIIIIKVVKNMFSKLVLTTKNKL